MRSLAWRLPLVRTRGIGYGRAGAPALGLLVWLLAFAVVSACGGGNAAPRDSIVPDELASRIAAGAPSLILDVRTPEEFAHGHIPGAINVPHTELQDRLGSFSPSQDEEIVVHCESGQRAAIAESVLRDAGYEAVRDLRGHMRGWRAGGYPIETSEEPERHP